jgi:hypothetical protein
MILRRAGRARRSRLSAACGHDAHRADERRAQRRPSARNTARARSLFRDELAGSIEDSPLRPSGILRQRRA